MVPEIVRLERAGVCGCGGLVAAGERAGYAATHENVVCLTCLAALSSQTVPGDASREGGDASPGGDVFVPAEWTARETSSARPVSDAPPARARQSRHGAETVEQQDEPAPAQRRRAGLFTRLMTVRSFRFQQGQPRVTGPDATVGALLDAATTKGVLTLHNRRVPGRRGRIEHIAVGASGVYVIDVKHFKNASIEVRPAGDASGDTDDLVVGGRVMTAAVVATGRRVTALRSLLAAVGLDDVPVTGAVCFVDGLMPLSVNDLEVAGIHVIRPSCLTSLVATAGTLVADDCQTLQQFLAEQLPASA